MQYSLYGTGAFHTLALLGKVFAQGRGYISLGRVIGPLLGPIRRVIGHYKEEQFWYCYNCGAKNSHKLTVCERCGKELLIRLAVEPIGIKHSTTEITGDSQLISPQPDTRESEKFRLNARTIVKTFLHGFLFALLFAALIVAWFFATLFLVSIGSLIGLAIGVGLLVLGIGGINGVLGGLLWKIPADTGFWSLLLHGFALFAILFVVGLITNFLPNLIYPGTATYIITLIVSSFIYGIIGRKVASWFRD